MEEKWSSKAGLILTRLLILIALWLLVFWIQTSKDFRLTA
jgi:hypothetical protein